MGKSMAKTVVTGVIVGVVVWVITKRLSGPSAQPKPDVWV